MPSFKTAHNKTTANLTFVASGCGTTPSQLFVGSSPLMGKLLFDDVKIKQRVQSGRRSLVWWDLREINGADVSQKIIHIFPGSCERPDSRLSANVRLYRGEGDELLMPQSAGGAAAYRVSLNRPYMIAFHLVFMFPDGKFDAQFSTVPYQLRVRVPKNRLSDLPGWP